MLPPVDESVLTDNPDFEKLYKSLSTDILHPDGSTKKDAAAEQRDAVRQELKEYRLRATRHHLLKQAIATATPQSASSQPAAPKQIPQHGRTRSHLTRASSNPVAAGGGEEGGASSTSQQQLPPELVDLLLLLPDFLEKAPRQLLPQQTLRLLLSTPPFSQFPQHLASLTALLSTHLTTQAVALTRVLHPTTNASFLHRHTVNLPVTTSDLVAKLDTTRRELTDARLQTTTTLLSHLGQYARALAILVRALEAKHGPAAHSTALRSQRACLEAALWAASLRLLLVETKGRVYPQGSGGALRNYRRHLRDAQMRLEDASRVRERELEDYGVLVRPGKEEEDSDDENEMSTKERRMREMARIWREMEGRLVEIQADLDRLGKS
ncbi:hypothetical protein PG993_008607 [Apiospora rasikravindrae]|uniref:Uncharacterized protein n=1 Tax=Apiospora rasikravindrae TaxID=990691 RepID=A0ABR1T0T9_9PEZI